MRITNHRSTGFSLVELLVTIMVIGILAAVAFGSYQSHIRKGRRADAQAFLMDLVQRQQQYFTDSRAYATDVATLNNPLPASLSSFYTVQVATAATPPTFTITATAVGSQLSDGNLTINNSGAKTPSDRW